MAEYNPSKIIKDGNTYNFRDNTKIPLAGSNQISGDLIPATDNSIDVGSSTKNIKMLYTKGITIDGTQFLPSNFVDVTSAQTIRGVKTFSKIALKSSRIERGSLPSSNITEDNEIEIVDKNGRRILGIFNYYYANGNGRTGFYAYNPNTTDYDNISIVFDFDNINNQKSLIPVATNAIDLGSSTAQWNNAYVKALTINGTAAGDILTHNMSEFVPVTGTSALAGSIVPDTDNAYNLGDSTYGFASFYVNKIYLKGSTIFNLVDDNYICVGGATAQANGANLVLNGKNRSTSTGEFKLEARDGTNTRQLIGKPDGTLTWNNKNVAMQEGVVSRSGGNVFDGYIYSRNVSNDVLVFTGGTTLVMGAYLQLNGENRTNDPGCFSLIAKNSTNLALLQGTPSGTLTWNGQSIQTTSDTRLKQQISQIDDALLTAWEDVNLVQFKYNDAVEQKSDNARLHTGYVVQQIDEACKSHNVDISKYGLYCHEEYAEETREVEQADGTKKTEVVRPANEHYSLRYTEALIVECAYLRKKLKELTARIEQLEKGNNVK